MGKLEKELRRIREFDERQAREQELAEVRAQRDVEDGRQLVEDFLPMAGEMGIGPNNKLYVTRYEQREVHYVRRSRGVSLGGSTRRGLRR